MIQLLYKDEWQKLKFCPKGTDEEQARDMLEESRGKIKKRELRLVEVIPPPYTPPEIVVLDA